MSVENLKLAAFQLGAAIKTYNLSRWLSHKSDCDMASHKACSCGLSQAILAEMKWPGDHWLPKEEESNVR